MDRNVTGITEQLGNYIIKNIKKGYTMDSLKYSLMSQGYSKISVENAIEFANREMAKEITPVKEKPEITYKIVDESGDVERVSVNEGHGFLKGFLKKFVGRL